MTYKVTVVNIRTHPGAYYIGRPSTLSNQCKIGDGIGREAAIAWFESWFRQQILENNPSVLVELKLIHEYAKKKGAVALGCFCKPARACHGDIIKKFIDDNQEFLDEI